MLEASDVVVVAGNDERLVSETVSCDRPVYIHPLPGPREGPSDRVRAWVERRANRRPRNARGTARPQQGLEYLAARLIERGIVLPPSDPTELHAALYRRGAARPFGAALSTKRATGLHEDDDAAREVRARLGWPG
jgi:hypothetical protein